MNPRNTVLYNRSPLGWMTLLLCQIQIVCLHTQIGIDARLGVRGKNGYQVSVWGDENSVIR